MTVRLTPTESDTPPPPQVPAPLSPSEHPVTASSPDARVTGESSDPATPGSPARPEGSDGGDGPVAESRPALREARRQRRRTAWLCAAVVAVCLGLTIVVVSLARSRPVTPPASLSASTGPSARSVPVRVPATATALDRFVRLSILSRGAPASEGGNP